MEPVNLEEDTLYAEVGNFYLNSNKLHDVQFVVGEQKEKIKAVKLPLINQSRAWWSMLSEDSPLAEKGDIPLPDIDHEVFTLLLRHSYGGLEKLDDLSDDMFVKLCYCANKYFMKSLMTKVAARLEPKDVDSVFPALHCLSYYNLHGVEDGVKKTRTKKVFEHPEFLECDVDSITYICKQDTLGCDELTLWKAVVRWAKHKTEEGEGAELRQRMSQPLQHIRLLTLSEPDLCNHVFSLDVFNSKEIAYICNKNGPVVSSICKEKSCRHMLIHDSTCNVTVDITQEGYGHNNSLVFSNTSCPNFIVKEKNIELQTISCRGYAHLPMFTNYRAQCYSQKKEIDVNVQITRITDLMKNTSDEKPLILDVKGINHYFFDRITIPTMNNNKGIPLLANNKYKVELKFSLDMPCWTGPLCHNGHDFEHGTFYCSLLYKDGVGLTPSHIIQFTYGVADDENEQ